MLTLRCTRSARMAAVCAAFLLVCLVPGAWSDAHAAKAESGPQLFGTAEFKGPIKKLPKWSGVLAKMQKWEGYFKGTATEGLPSRSGWEKLRAEVKGKSDLEKLKAVNKFFNQWPYRLDQGNYGEADYWAAPYEFLKKSGDCEDYSIAKYYALKELGFSADRMRIVAVKDVIRNIGHAILAVYMDGDVLILDNQTVMVISHTKYKHYVPQYSVNEKFRWYHVPKGKMSTFKKFKKKK